MATPTQVTRRCKECRRVLDISFENALIKAPEKQFTRGTCMENKVGLLHAFLNKSIRSGKEVPSKSSVSDVDFIWNGNSETSFFGYPDN